MLQVHKLIDKKVAWIVLLAVIIFFYFKLDISNIQPFWINPQPLTNYCNWYNSYKFTFRSVTFYVNLFSLYLSLPFRSVFSLSPSHEKLTHKFMHINTYIELQKLSSFIQKVNFITMFSPYFDDYIPFFFPFLIFLLSVIIICSRMNCRNPMMISHTYNHYRSPKITILAWLRIRE